MSDDIIFCGKKDPYYEFSNYYESPIIINKKSYICVEHYFQSEKFNHDEPDNDTKEYYDLIMQIDSPQKAKNMGTMKTNYRGGSWYINKSKPELGKMNDIIRRYKDRVFLRSDWEENKIWIMQHGLEKKFTQNKSLKSLLLNTENCQIIEKSHRDSFWGNARGTNHRGKNHLGQLIMKVRNGLRQMDESNKKSTRQLPLLFFMKSKN